MTNNRSANAILSREWRLFKPLGWMVFAGLLLLAGATAFGAARGEPKAPALVVLDPNEQSKVSDVSVTLLETAPEKLPEATTFVSGFTLQLPGDATFSHSVQLNLGGSPAENHQLLRLEAGEWKPVESAQGTRSGVAVTASTQTPGTFVLVAVPGQSPGSR